VSEIPGTKKHRPWCAEGGHEADDVFDRPLGRHGAMVKVCADCDPTNDAHLEAAFDDDPIREYEPRNRLTVKEMREGVTKLAESVRGHMPATMVPMSRRR